MFNFTSMKKILLLLFFTALIIADCQAQCAMCKSVVESNIEGGNAIGSGLNDGILYLMAMPYISLGLIAFFWSRYNRSCKS